MEKYITDDRTRLKYELIGDYYLIAGEDESEEERQPIGIWGQRHARYLKQHHKILYYNLLTKGKLNYYLADIDERAEEMYLRLIDDMAEKQGVTEQLKANQPMEWVGKMGNIQNCAREVVNSEVIFV